MSNPNKPPPPVQPHDFDDAVRGMREMQIPPTFPVNSFLGQPGRYRGNFGNQTQPVQQRPENTRWTTWNGQGDSSLPPLRTQSSAGPSVPPSSRSNTRQAVPISKLLADPSCPPPQTNASTPPHHALTRHGPHFTSSPGQSSNVDRTQLPILLQGPTRTPISLRRNSNAPFLPFPADRSMRREPIRTLDTDSHVSSPSISPSCGSSLNSPRLPGSLVSARQCSVPRTSQPADPKYLLRMRQQPIAARACGFGERDRRVVDPPPIVEVVPVDKASSTGDDETPLIYGCLHCNIVHADSLVDASTIEQSRNDMALTQRLMGTCIASPFIGKDERGTKGTFFVFPDLSCRSPGKYRFRFRLLVVDASALATGASVPIDTEIYSDQFEVFSAKEFPGMRASSGLLVTLRKQGLNVAVKKGREATKKSTRKTRNAGYDSDEDEEMDEDDDEGDERDAKKRKSYV